MGGYKADKITFTKNQWSVMEVEGYIIGLMTSFVSI